MSQTDKELRDCIEELTEAIKIEIGCIRSELFDEDGVCRVYSHQDRYGMLNVPMLKAKKLLDK